jgi:peptidoglycan/LPS O-acetylase OafA/YrhL
MGYFRFSLIIAVVYYHLAGQMIAGPAAVYGFFLLSGYVITLVTAEIYNKGWRSKWYFMANRAARVWPTYLACLAVALACMALVGFTTGFYQREFLFPSSPESWLVQFSIVGLSDFAGERWPERILPPAWSLSTEIVYYLIIGLITGSSRRLTAAAFGVAIAISAYLLFNDYPYRYFYFSIQGPAVAFFTGAMFYHYRGVFQGMYLRETWLLIILANAVLYLPDLIGLQRKEVLVLYITTFYLSYIVMCLHILSQKARPGRFEQFLADITYPMFLLHWPVGAVICYYWFGDYRRDTDVFLLAFPLTFIVSAAIVYAVEMPMKRVRRHFREYALKEPGVP